MEHQIIEFFTMIEDIIYTGKEYGVMAHKTPCISRSALLKLLQAKIDNLDEQMFEFHFNAFMNRLRES